MGGGGERGEGGCTLQGAPVNPTTLNPQPCTDLAHMHSCTHAHMGCAWVWGTPNALPLPSRPLPSFQNLSTGPPRSRPVLECVP